MKKIVHVGNSHLRATEDSEMPLFGAQENFELKDDQDENEDRVSLFAPEVDLQRETPAFTKFISHSQPVNGNYKGF